MHYHCEVWTKEKPENVELFLENIMKPYEENEDGTGFWDWYQIGGRWTGVKTNYSPEEDPENYEKCHLCTNGYRNDTVGKDARIRDNTYTCNGCGYYDTENKRWQQSKFKPGWRLKWPTDWKLFDGDICPVEKIENDLFCHTLIVNEKVFHTYEWNGEEFEKTDFDGNVKEQLKKLNITDGYLITVDYHS